MDLPKPEAVLVQGSVMEWLCIFRENGSVEFHRFSDITLRAVKQGDFLPPHILALTPQGQQMMQKAMRG